MSPHKLRDMLDRLTRFRQPADLEDVDHRGPDLEVYGDAVGGGFLGDADAVVAEHFLVAGLNQQRWNAAEIAEDRRGQRIAGIGLVEIAAAKLGHRLRAD